MNKKLSLLSFAFLLIPLIAEAQRPIELLEPLPGTAQITLGTNPLDALNQYLQPFLPVVIALSAGISVIMIIYGGLQIMMGGGNIAQSEGMNRILTAIMGLMILIFSATLLYMLNSHYFVVS